MNETEMVLASNKMHNFHLLPVFFPGATFISDSRSFWRGHAFWCIQTLMAKFCHVWLLLPGLERSAEHPPWTLRTQPQLKHAMRREGARDRAQEHHWMLGGTWMLMGKMRCGSCMGGLSCRVFWPWLFDLKVSWAEFVAGCRLDKKSGLWIGFR